MSNKINVDGNEYEAQRVGGRDEPVFKCLKCKVVIKREQTLRKHLTSSTHKNYDINAYFWEQKSQRYLDKPFQSLLNPSVKFDRVDKRESFYPQAKLPK